MNVNARGIATAALFGAAACGMIYTAFAMAQLRRFAREPRKAGCKRFITVLKPLHGDEEHLYENLRSFCDQRYERFEVIFGAADASDPALEVARRLQHEFAERAIRIVAGAPGKARNPKVANLLGMEPSIRGDLIVLADSDMRVDDLYLQHLDALFDDAGFGAATCIFSGLPNESAASRIGAMAITDEFSPSVLVAASLAPVDFCMGATLAVRRVVFESFGGFAAIADCLADDYEIGQRVFKAGYRIVIAPFSVATMVPERRLRDIWEHEVRWARTVFRARPAGFAGTIVLHYVALAAAALVTARLSPASIALFAAAASMRVWNHALAHRVLAPGVRPAWHMLPVRVGLSLGVWGAAFSGRRIGWRGTDYEVNAKGRLVDNPGGM